MQAPGEIRDIRLDDVDACAAIYNHYVAHTTVTFELEPVDGREFAARIDAVTAHGLPWLVLVDANGVRGYAYAAPWRVRPAYRHSVEVSVYLAPDAIGRGFGAQLYLALIERLQAWGAHALIGGVALPNAASVRLHESLGFTQVALFREVGYKFGAWIDVGYWQRLLPAGPALHCRSHA